MSRLARIWLCQAAGSERFTPFVPRPFPGVVLSVRLASALTVLHRCLRLAGAVAGGGYASTMGIRSDENLIAEASRRLADAAPNAKVILFGSHARGEARPDSDLDLLVIEPELKSRRAESVRLREALGNLGVPIDLVVVPASHVDEWGHFEGTMLNDALREGRVLVPA